VKLTTHPHLVQRLRMYGAIPSLPHYVFMVLYLVKHGDKFTFSFTVVMFLKMKVKLLYAPK